MQDIFARLRTKTCLKCKLVCKEWYQIIISDEFADLRSSSRKAYLTMLIHGKFYGKRLDFLLLEFNESLDVDKEANLIVSDDGMIRFKTNFDIPHIRMEVVNECNGLICLASFRNYEPYLVCNLLTGEKVIVRQYWNTSYLANIYGLGCCPVSRQYKVVRTLEAKADIINAVIPVKCVAQIQTVGGTGEWRTITGDAPFHNESSCHKVFLHGSLHMYSYRKKCIWSFHYGKERFLRFPIPSGIKVETIGSVCVFDSCLCLSLLNTTEGKCGVWLMKEYGVEASWVKLFVFDSLERFNYYIPRTSFSPLWKCNEKIILASRGYMLSSLHVRDERLCSEGINVKIRGELTFKSLLVPFNTKFSKIDATTTPADVKLKSDSNALSSRCHVDRYLRSFKKK